MDPHAHIRPMMSPRMILLSAVEAATRAGGCDAAITARWDHAKLVSRLAGELSLLAGVDPTDAASAALVHDVGELLLLARHPEEYGAIGVSSRAHHRQLDVERARFGVDHAMLGADHLLEHRIPHVMADAVADHHNPFADAEPTTIVVAAADEIADEDPDRRHALDLLGVSAEAAEFFLAMARRRHPRRRAPQLRVTSLTQ